MAEDLRWYVLRAAQPLKAADRMKELKAELNGEIPTFKDLRVPIRYVAPQKRALMKRDHPMVFNYLFVLARLKDISSFLARYPELKTWVLSSRWTEDADHNYRRTAPSISQTEIEDFFRLCDAIAKVEAHYIPFVNITEESLKEGELVKVIGGFFDGHTGYLMDQKDDTVVLQMMDGLGAPVKIKGAVLERVNVRGVKNAKYALFDDFFSRVNPILQRMLANQHTGDDLAYAMHCLHESQGMTDLSSKLKSKQLTLQLICQTLLNNRQECQRLLDSCNSFLPKVWDKRQRALQAAYIYVCRPFPEHYSSAADCMNELQPAKRQEIEEILKYVQIQ